MKITKKETIIKAITEMDISLLDVILDDDRAYMDVSKKLFLETLSSKFNTLKRYGTNKFEVVRKGSCVSTHKGCNGCKGYTFLTRDNNYLDLIFKENNNEIEDLFLCSELVNEEKLQKDNNIYFSFREDEKVKYDSTVNLVDEQKTIRKAEQDFEKFENTITDIEVIMSWYYKYEAFNKSLTIYDRLNYDFIKSFTSIFNTVDDLHVVIEYNTMASLAMVEFEKLDKENEIRIIDWLIKFENNELYENYCYEVIDNQETLYLIKLLDSKFTEKHKNVIIDVKSYKESIVFYKTYKNLYDIYLEKYHPTKELFAIYGGFVCDLSEFLSARNLFPEILIKYNIQPKEKIIKI